MIEKETRDQLRKDMINGHPRYTRAARTAAVIQGALRDFLPQDRDCARRISEFLLEAAYGSNMALINVPAEYDLLLESQIASAMVEKLSTPPILPT